MYKQCRQPGRASVTNCVCFCFYFMCRETQQSFLEDWADPRREQMARGLLRAKTLLIGRKQHSGLVWRGVERVTIKRLPLFFLDVVKHIAFTLISDKVFFYIYFPASIFSDVTNVRTYILLHFGPPRWTSVLPLISAVHVRQIKL